VSMLITIIAKMGQILERTNLISLLEQKIMRFPYKQTMPCRVRHFTNGLASIVPGAHVYIVVSMHVFPNFCVF